MQSALEGLEGVRSAKVLLVKDNAVVIFNQTKVTIEQMKRSVSDVGYGVSHVSEISPYRTSGQVSTGSSSSGEQPTRDKPVSIRELTGLIDDPDVVLINVHIPYAGEIPGTDAFIPYNRVRESRDELPENKDAEILVYCRSGHMSKIALKVLTEMGYTNVYDVPGGMNAWRRAGNELLDKSK